MRVLSIDGGGFLGLATAAFIDGAEKHLKRSFHKEFDLFCGTSTGAIIALSLAIGKSAAEIVELYRKLGKGVFQTRWYSRVPVFTTKYDNVALRRHLDEVFGDLTLGDLLDHGKKVLITSYCVTTGSPRIFKTDHSPNLSLHNRLRITDVALASSAAPTYFPLVRIDAPTGDYPEYFCDGGVVSNNPALLGFTEAIQELQALPRDVRLLSLSTPRKKALEKKMGSLRRGIIGWALKLPEVLIDSPAQIVDQMLRRIVTSYPDPKPEYLRMDFENHWETPIDKVTPNSIETLMNEGHSKSNDGETRRELERFFQT